ncbi:ABC transporter ATP-binding protein [Acetobacter lovaniensis]|jgi:putative ABC transport system ATP-binding protein|uniref:ABC transporter ATP-binding protein n=1 Tax=Acetobacter TaxID=434 RepID=UPI00140A4E07|nr:ATP-binding cassette domain-containing protein [Acetobacter lovaniensis]MCI1795357.1 ATP-binding cassette domain-containing protein [Acetobacter lovaniensis]MCP1240708.1 ATP-binding cassette domain-containing protein [Acetobacter lovaniensis]NHN82739.1 ATP-binding cassette domain-containing protein [Acetobacter lovaniensis]
MSSVLPELVRVRSLEWRSPDKNFSLFVPNFVLKAGECLAIVGPSGCGKSTLLGLLSLALRPTAGSIQIEGQEVASCWQTKQGIRELGRLRARHLGFVPQMCGLLPFLSVRANIALPLRVLERDDHGRILECAQRLGIASLLDRVPASLSVGQRQRVAIARAVVHRPRVVMADEPTAALHPDQADDAMRLLFEHASTEAAVIMVTHDAVRAEEAGFVVVRVVPQTAGAMIATTDAAP